MNRKFQVFISSTYRDLLKERQTAVQAVLDAGHIPAGMELFAAGDEAQLAVIKRWIDESDIYMLILGVRYGTPEPTSKKGYTHVEYEYAAAQGKPVFAVYLAEAPFNDRVKELAIELANEDRKGYATFRDLVKSKRVRLFWCNGAPQGLQRVGLA
jgi:nucleoside 2-deoxyribosyltransferase